MLKHYLNLFEKNEFDEYDVYGFLILVRDYTKGWIHDFCHLIAHRIREKGKIYCMIEKTLCLTDSNGELLIDKGKKTVTGYRGIANGTLQNELNQFAKLYGHCLSKRTLDEIVLCIFSIAHLSTYKVGNLGCARMSLSINNKNELWLCTEMECAGKLIGNIGFAKLKYNPINTQKCGIILQGATEVLREKGKIQVWCDGIDISN